VKNKLKVLDLFSGLGGFSLGLERTGHFKTVAFCDNNKYSKLVIDKHWKGIKIYDDIREITKEKFTTDGIETPDIITGGFPCQPFSVAGKQKGTSDDRHLWPEMFRIIKAFKPRYVIGENVRGIINIQDGVVFETVCTDLESEGYEVQPFIIPAAGVGAPHRRERVWIIANREESMVDSDNIRFQQHSTTKEESSGRGTSATSESTSSTIKNMENSDSRGRGWQERFRTHDLRRSESKEQNNNFDKTSEGRSQGGVESSRSNVVNTISNDEGREISRSDEEKRRIQEEHRTEHSTTGKSSRTSEIRNGDNGYETTESNVADTHSSNQRTGKKSKQQEGNTSRECFSNSSEYVADTNTRFGNGENEEIQSRGQTSDSSSTRGRENVADTESIGSDVRGREQHQGERSGQGEIGGASSSNVADTIGERGRSRITERENAEDVRQSPESSNTGWWHVEPNVGRVAHGVSGRVHRLKGLGNSIVPQIVEEIGKALIKAERSK